MIKERRIPMTMSVKKEVTVTFTMECTIIPRHVNRDKLKRTFGIIPVVRNRMKFTMHRVTNRDRNRKRIINSHTK